MELTLPSIHAYTGQFAPPPRVFVNVCSLHSLCRGFVTGRQQRNTGVHADLPASEVQSHHGLRQARQGRGVKLASLAGCSRMQRVTTVLQYFQSMQALELAFVRLHVFQRSTQGCCTSFSVLCCGRATYIRLHVSRTAAPFGTYSDHRVDCIVDSLTGIAFFRFPEAGAASSASGPEQGRARWKGRGRRCPERGHTCMGRRGAGASRHGQGACVALGRVCLLPV